MSAKVRVGEDATKGECLLCGYTTTSPTWLELWNGYGECVGPDHADGEWQRTRWTMPDGATVLTMVDDGLYSTADGDTPLPDHCTITHPTPED